MIFDNGEQKTVIGSWRSKADERAEQKGLWTGTTYFWLWAEDNQWIDDIDSDQEESEEEDKATAAKATTATSSTAVRSTAPATLTSQPTAPTSSTAPAQRRNNNYQHGHAAGAASATSATTCQTTTCPARLKQTQHDGQDCQCKID